jgi:hypothetical protein
MATMQATAIISAVDRATPVFSRVAASAAALARSHQATAASFSRVGALATAAFALPAVAGFNALISRTQDFEKALVGVKIAGIADNLEKGVVNFEAINEQAAKTREEAMRLSKALALSPTGLLQSGEAALKMGLAADKVSRLMEMSGSVHIQDREITMQKAAEFLGTQGLLFGAGKDGRDYNTDITKIANQWLGVANMTRTSASKIEEGLRQFAPLYSSFGETFGNTAALIGGMVQAGQMDVESGTALKSLGVRLLKPTREGLKSLEMAGIDRSKFMDLTPVTGKIAWSNLSRMTDVQLSKPHRKALESMLLAGERGNLFQNEEYQQRLLQLYNNATGARSQDAKDRNQQRILLSLLTGGGKIKMMDFIVALGEAMESGKLTPAQMAHIGEGRHLSRYQALFKMLPFVKELREKLRDVNSEFTDGGNKIWRDSDAGKWEAAVASMDRALIKLRSSEGVRALIGVFETIADKIATLPPGVSEAGGKFLALAAAFTAFGLAAKGVQMALSTLAGNPLMRALIIGGATMGGLGIFREPEKGTRPWAEMQEDQFLGANSPIFQTFNELERVVRAVASFAATISSDFATLFGLDPTDSPLVLALTKMNELVRGIADTIRWIEGHYKVATGRAEEKPGLMPPGDINGNPAQQALAWTEIWIRMVKGLMERWTGNSGPPGQTAPPVQVQGQVQGQADLNIKVEPSPEFRAFIDSVRRMRIDGQIGNGNGVTMPDGQAPAAPQQ